MQRFLFLFILFFLFIPLRTFAINNTCQLTPDQMEELTYAFADMPKKPAISCDNYLLTVSFPAHNKATAFTLPVPFNLFEEDHEFYGLARYYNGSRPLELNTEVAYLDLPTISLAADENNWFGWNARFSIFLVNAPNSKAVLTDEIMQFAWNANTPITMQIYLGPTEGQFASVKYSYLWSWLAALCRGIEMLLVMLGSLLGNAWGIAIIVLAILFKFVCLPLQLWVTKLQQEVGRCQAILTPKLKLIKSQYDGEEAHHRIMAEYKQLGITPFFGMKPLIGPLIQLPIQIAIFNVLGEMPKMVGASFLWIDNLAYPDTLNYLPFTVPFLGNEFNLLPVLMTVTAFISTALMHNPHGTASEIKWKKYRLYLMAVVFFILFYPFPAAMALFWTMMNLLHLIQQQVIK